MNLSRIKPPLLAVFFIALAGLACATGGDQTDTPVADTDIVPATSDEGSSGDNPADVVPTLSRGSGSFDLVDPGFGLDTLNSYRANLTITFAGQSGDWTESYLLEVVQQPWASHFESSADGLHADTFGFINELTSNGVTYTLSSDNNCSPAVTDPELDRQPLVQPALWIPPVTGADEAGQETMNGLDTIHYTFNESAIGAEGISEATGELWVAADGGFLVRYRLEEHGPPDYFPDGDEGTLTITYDLTDINQPIEINPPPDCPPGLVDVPLPPDSVVTVDQPGFLSYTISLDAADIAAFYQEQLAVDGWSPVDEPAVTDNMIWLDFTRDGLHLSIQATSDENGTVVNIWLQKQTE